MSTLQLIIGNKNYSTWSMRPWLLLDAFGMEFDEKLVSLRDEGLSARLAEFSGAKRVPVLIDDGLTIWDSLAICEHLSEQYLDGQGWPSVIADKALARAITAEMHSGFAALRNELPMNCRASRIIEMSDDAKADIQRIDNIWSQYAQPDSQGALCLFGKFSIADCFFAPVVMRCITYGVALSDNAQAYADSIRAHPSVERWVSQAVLETEVIEVDEAGVDRV